MELNTVDNIINCVNLNTLTYELRLQIKSLGPHRPDLNINQNFNTSASTAGAAGAGCSKKNYNRKFNRNLYEAEKWLCGCEKRNAFFCFICLVMNNPRSDPAWVAKGMRDIKHFGEKIKRHKVSTIHLNNHIEFSMLGKVDIRCQLNSAYRQNIIEHNENVTKNRHILSRLIDCIKFCGVFEVALRGHDESNASVNPGIFRGLVNLLAEIDGTLKEHINKTNNRVFMGLSKTIQNELLDSIYAVCRNVIISEINKADYVAVMADETTDCATLSQLVLLIRYELSGQIHERFMGFLAIKDHTAEGISGEILKELKNIGIDKNPQKLIAQSYDGAAVMSGKDNGVQAKIKSIYSNAHYIHCYAHQLNLIIERSANQNKQIRVFFCNIEGFSTFFSRSPKRTTVLDEVVKKRLPRAVGTRWNFKSRCVTTVYVYKTEIILCLTQIIEDPSNDKSTVRKAVGLKNMLKDPDFLYWLYFFNKIMPNCDILFNQLQSRDIDSIKMQKCISSFKQSIQNVRDATDYDNFAGDADHEDNDEPVLQPKRPRYQDVYKNVAKEVCDVIITAIEDRFRFSEHLSIATLFQPSLFSKFQLLFPDIELELAVKYFNLDKYLLKHELTVIYSRQDFASASGALPLLQCFYENNLYDAFPESLKLLKIICTMPMTTVECERSFSTLKRIKTFTRNTMCESRLNALAMCSIEKKLLANNNFNDLVIEHFAHAKERRMDFIYKQIN